MAVNAVTNSTSQSTTHSTEQPQPPSHPVLVQEGAKPKVSESRKERKKKGSSNSHLKRKSSLKVSEHSQRRQLPSSFKVDVDAASTEEIS